MGEDGSFRFLVLQPGIYRLEASHAGFKASRRDNIIETVVRYVRK